MVKCRNGVAFGLTLCRSDGHELSAHVSANERHWSVNKVSSPCFDPDEEAGPGHAEAEQSLIFGIRRRQCPEPVMGK
jgi:hypothetical protein